MSDKHLNLPVTTDDSGNVTFAPDVVATIAGLAAMEIEGVAGMSSGGSSFGDLLARKQLTKGVKVEVGTEEVAVDLTMVLEYGLRIPEVTRAVQENVKKAIENMTGLRVVEVNIFVSGIRFQKETPPEEEEPEQLEEETAPAPEPQLPPRVK